MKCPNCGQETNDVVCSCGYRFPTIPAGTSPQKRFCSNCGAEVTGKFCAACGKPVEQPSPYSAPQNSAQYAPRSSPSKSSHGDPSKNGVAVAGFVLSLISFLFCVLIVPVITAIIGLVLSIIGHKSEKKKLATAGIVFGVFAIVMVVGFSNVKNNLDALDGSTHSVSSSSSVASKTSSKSASKVSSSGSSSQPLEVKGPTTSLEVKEPTIFYEEISFYVPENWEYVELQGLPYYYYDGGHFLFIKTVALLKDKKLSPSQIKDLVVTSFETDGSSKKTRDLDTSKYNVEMSGFEGNTSVQDNKVLLTSTYILKTTDYVYLFNFAGSTEDDEFDSQKDLILNSIVVSNSDVQASKPVAASAETDSSYQSSSKSTVAPTGETTSQKNAIKTAKSYLRYTSFSHEGLVQQLEFEKFSRADAVYGADHCGADWDEQAIKKAKSYLEYTSFSYSGLIDQLEFEHFTSDQATYGADNCGADWNEQAVKKAKSYLQFSSFSKDALIDQLEFEGFTHEQAVHGAEGAGY